MTAALLDVNVLIALMWPAHEGQGALGVAAFLCRLKQGSPLRLLIYGIKILVS